MFHDIFFFLFLYISSTWAMIWEECIHDLAPLSILLLVVLRFHFRNVCLWWPLYSYFISWSEWSISCSTLVYLRRVRRENLYSRRHVFAMHPSTQYFCCCISYIFIFIRAERFFLIQNAFIILFGPFDLSKLWILNIFNRPSLNIASNCSPTNLGRAIIFLPLALLMSWIVGLALGNAFSLFLHLLEGHWILCVVHHLYLLCLLLLLWFRISRLISSIILLNHILSWNKIGCLL